MFRRFNNFKSWPEFAQSQVKDQQPEASSTERDKARRAAVLVHT